MKNKEELENMLKGLDRKQMQNLMDNSLLSYIDDSDLTTIRKIVSSSIEKARKTLVEETGYATHPSAMMVTFVCSSVMVLSHDHSRGLIEALVKQTLDAGEIEGAKRHERERNSKTQPH